MSRPNRPWLPRTSGPMVDAAALLRADARLVWISERRSGARVTSCMVREDVAERLRMARKLRFEAGRGGRPTPPIEPNIEQLRAEIAIKDAVIENLRRFR